MAKNSRSYNWTFLLYPESMNRNYLDYLKSGYFSFAISPLHDMDLEEDGSLKKPHYHVVLHFDTLKSYSQLLEITVDLSGTIPQKVFSLSGVTRYLIHADDKAKFQYSRNDIYSYNFDLDKYISSPNIQSDFVQYLLDILDSYSFDSFALLVSFIRVDRPEFLTQCLRNTYFINNLFYFKKGVDD